MADVFNMKIVILFLDILCTTLIASEPAQNTSSVPILVYYETHCPDSIRFITQQLYPTYKKLGKLMNPFLVPYGKADHYTDKKGNLVFNCPHGPEECEGNMVHACILNTFIDMDQIMDYIFCTMDVNTGTEFLWQYCAKKYNMNYKLIYECMHSSKGPMFLAQMGQITAALKPPLTDLPTIVIDSIVFSLLDRFDGPDNTEVNFRKALCSQITAVPTPEECLHELSHNNAYLIELQVRIPLVVLISLHNIV